MRISIISFTGSGIKLSYRLQELLEGQHEVRLYTKKKPEGEAVIEEDCPYVEEDLAAWTGRQFAVQDGLVFIGAAGIAVRAVAPYARDKLKDPAVLVLDETGAFVIPILSGHYGGANELAESMAGKIGAIPVITTATDRNRLFAVDVFAAKNGLKILNREGIAAVSSAVLDRRRVTIRCGGEITGSVPEELCLLPLQSEEIPDILVSAFVQKEQYALLQLCPAAYTVGIGCRRGKSCTELKAAVEKQLAGLGIHSGAISCIASVAHKSREAGLLELAEEYGVPFWTFLPEELMAVKGSFTASDFVRQSVGADNVCERAALAAAGEGGRLLIRKQAEYGITVAIAQRKWGINFEA